MDCMSNVTICIESEGTKKRCRRHANGSYNFWCEKHGEEHERSWQRYINGEEDFAGNNLLGSLESNQNS